eukprot:227716-Amphidinium_carterae.1
MYAIFFSAASHSTYDAGSTNHAQQDVAKFHHLYLRHRSAVFRFVSLPHTTLKDCTQPSIIAYRLTGAIVAIPGRIFALCREGLHVLERIKTLLNLVDDAIQGIKNTILRVI